MQKINNIAWLRWLHQKKNWLILVIIIAILAVAAFIILQLLQKERPYSSTTVPSKSLQTVAVKSTVSADTPAIQPNKTTANTTSSHSDPTSIDVLVNKKHPLTPMSYVPSDLVSMDGATISNKAAPSFDAMVKAAAASGINLTVNSSYRSYNTQVSVYNGWVAQSGQAEADTYSARPGYSEHQTGFAVDLGANGAALSDFNGTPAAQWLSANAAQYGFIQRYPIGYEAITGYENEEWHYRYVGTAVAQDMAARDIRTLEQYWGITGGDYN